MFWRTPLVLLAILVSPLAISHEPSGAAVGRRLAPLSGDLMRHVAHRRPERVRVIVRGNPAVIEAAAQELGVRVLRALDGFVVVRANAAEVTALRERIGVQALSGDLLVASTMVVSDKAMATDQTRAGKTGLLGVGGYAAVNGSGVGVAVVDSGIYAHKALAGKVTFSKSFVTGDTSVDDKFGHGTHIAGIIAGSGAYASSYTSAYKGGVAPGAHLINVRVLGAQGTGYTSDVIAGINWVVQNRALYKIRIINLSLGHPVSEPCVTDPLCGAVAQAANVGLLVVASAGNRGKAADGSMVLGSITSPGNSPYALTVGALNTWGTVKRTDDTVTTYSSRGPTRYDLAVKPDVVAPGNKVVSLEAPNSYLKTTYASEHVGGSGNNGYYRMNGTSMAAAMVSGSAALLLQGNPTLQPRQVKFALQSTASYMVDGGLSAAGAGSVNVWSARRQVADGLLNNLLNGLLSLPTSLIGGVVAQPGGVVFWDAGTMSERLYDGSGLRLLGLVDGLLALLDTNRLAWGDLNVIGSGNPVGTMYPNQIIWGDISYWTTDQQIIWGDQITTPEGQQIIWGDSEMSEDYQATGKRRQIIWGDSHVDSGSQD